MYINGDWIKLTWIINLFKQRALFCNVDSVSYLKGFIAKTYKFTESILSVKLSFRCRVQHRPIYNHPEEQLAYQIVTFSLFMASLEYYSLIFSFCVQTQLFGRNVAILITYILHVYCKIRVAGKLFLVNNLLTLSPNFSNNSLAYSTKCGRMESLPNPPRSCRYWGTSQWNMVT